MTNYVLDSTRYIQPAKVVGFTPPGAKSKCSGIIRYAGTPDLAWKNITPNEQAAYNVSKLPVAHVHERGAGDALLGRKQGVIDADSMLSDLTKCNAKARAAHFVVQDTDYSGLNWKTELSSYIEGVHSIFDPSHMIVSAYGGYDVLKFLFDESLIRIGWQTKAWSGGRVEARASLYQQLGYVYPNGIQCDWNTAGSDWGQNLLQAGGLNFMLTPEQERRLNLAVDQILGAAVPGQLDFDGTLRSISARIDAVKALVTANDTALATQLTDENTAVLTAIAGVDVSHLTDQEIAELAGQISAQLPTVQADVFLNALKTRLES